MLAQLRKHISENEKLQDENQAIQEKYALLKETKMAHLRQMCPNCHDTSLDRSIDELHESEQREAIALEKLAAMNADDDVFKCWEFNAKNGCKKGNYCWWSHKWLANSTKHPWTGESLPGIVDRAMQDPDCDKDPSNQRFHDNGRIYWQRNREYMNQFNGGRSR